MPGACPEGLLYETPALCQPLHEVLDVRRAMLDGIGRRVGADEPGIGDECEDVFEIAAPELARQARVGTGEVVGLGQEHMLADHRKGAARVRRRAVPAMVEIQRRAVVDQPGVSMPDQQVRIPEAAIDIAHERVEPDDFRCQGTRYALRDGIEIDRPREVIECEVEAVARLDEFLDFRVRLGPREFAIEFDEHELRHRQAEPACDLAGDQFGDQRLHTLAGAAEFQDVQAVVIAFDGGGQRTAFAQGRDVACGIDGA